MAYRDRPHLRVPPDGERCEAWCPPQPNSSYQTWQKQWRRCCRPANQGRESRLVCHIHAAVKDCRWGPPLSSLTE